MSKKVVKQEPKDGSLCPMRDSVGTWTECVREKCAWWERYGDRCAVLDIAIGIWRGK